MIDLRVFFDKSQFLWRLDSVQSKEKNLEMNPGWTTSEFYRNFQSKSQYYWTRFSRINKQVIVKMAVSYVPKCFTNFHFNFVFWNLIWYHWFDFCTQYFILIVRNYDFVWNYTFVHLIVKMMFLFLNYKIIFLASNFTFRLNDGWQIKDTIVIYK